MGAVGFTKARSMGPVAEAVERAGGSVARVFRKAELPLRLIEAPEQFILLRDQLALVEHAARELDDEALPLRLSTQAGMQGLGVFGRRVRTAPTLADAIERCNSGIRSMLQSMTHMNLTQTESGSRRLTVWTYEILDDAPVGRQKNELLAFGYMLSTLKHFAAGAPLRATLPQKPPERAALEDILGCEVVAGEKAALIFPAECLRNANFARVDPIDARVDDVTAADGFFRRRRTPRENSRCWSAVLRSIVSADDWRLSAAQPATPARGRGRELRSNSPPRRARERASAIARRRDADHADRL